MQEHETIHIDIAKVIQSKAPHTRIPKFIISYLRKIVHEEDLNNFFRTYPNLRNVEFVEAVLKDLEIGINVICEDNLPPKEGRYIFVGNHPLGGLDGIIMAYLLGKKYDGNIRFLVNDLLMNLYPMRDLFLPVNKTGMQDKSYTALIQQTYQSNNQMFIYPAGKCSRKIKGRIIDTEWKKSFIAKSIEHQRDLVPIYFEGKNSNFFYNLANLRTTLRIGFNIEMLYLANEMYKQRGKHFTITIGKPIPWQTFDNTKNHIAWAQWVKDLVYGLAKNA